MRSYKETLTEYLSEQQFADLTKHWYAYFANLCSVNNTNYQLLQSYPPIQCESDLEECFDSYAQSNLTDVFHFVSFNRLSELSVKLINRIECWEDQLLNKHDSAFKEGWLEYKKVEKANNFPFKYLESLKSWFVLNDKAESGIHLSEASHSRIAYIDQYYSKRKEDQFPDFYLRFLSESNYKELTIDYSSSSGVFEKNNVQDRKAIEEGQTFFIVQEELEEINQLALSSPIKINGLLKGFQKLKVDSDYVRKDQKLIKAVLYDFQSELIEAFGHEEVNKIKKIVAYRPKELYCISEFDLTLEIDNEFEFSDVEMLRKVSFSCFPFFFSSDVEHYKWIEYTHDKKIVIRMKSKKPQCILLGADIEK